MGSLGKELFEEDPDHEAYWRAVREILERVDRSAIPERDRESSASFLQDELAVRGGAGLFSDYRAEPGPFASWIHDLSESFSDAFVLVREEEWDVDPEVASKLIDQCMVEFDPRPLRDDAEPMTRADPMWVSMVELGLRTDLDEWRLLNDYVRSSGAFDRLVWVFPKYLTLGRRHGSRFPDEREQWESANLFAWRHGISSSLIYRLGLSWAEPAAVGSGGRKSNSIRSIVRRLRHG